MRSMAKMLWDAFTCNYNNIQAFENKWYSYTISLNQNVLGQHHGSRVIHGYYSYTHEQSETVHINPLPIHLLVWVFYFSIYNYIYIRCT